MAKKRPVRFRDKRTGRFVSRATYKRSKAHHGTRYVHERIKVKARKRAPLPAPRRHDVDEESDFAEYLVAWQYEKTGKTLSFVAVADSPDAALEYVADEMEQDSKARSIVQAGFSGWTPRVARGRRARKKRDGEVTYRESKRN